MSACDFEELLRFKPESSRLVRDHIEHLKKSYHISNIDILIQAGVCLEDEKDRFGPKISKYIKDFDKHWRILGEEAHRKLVKYLLDNHFWGDEIDCRLVSSIPELAIYQFEQKVVDVTSRCVIQGIRPWRNLEAHHGRHQGNCGQLRRGTQASPAETA